MKFILVCGHGTHWHLIYRQRPSLVNELLSCCGCASVCRKTPVATRDGTTSRLRRLHEGKSNASTRTAKHTGDPDLVCVLQAQHALGLHVFVQLWHLGVLWCGDRISASQHGPTCFP